MFLDCHDDRSVCLAEPLRLRPPAQPAHIRFCSRRSTTHSSKSSRRWRSARGAFARTAFRVRERFPIDKSLSLIAEIDGTPCGSVWMTPVSVGGIDGYMLGPLATHPGFRKRGVGKHLAHEVTRIALERGQGELRDPDRRSRLLLPAGLAADDASARSSGPARSTRPASAIRN